MLFFQNGFQCISGRISLYKCVCLCLMKIIYQIRHLTFSIVMVSFDECFSNSIKMCGDGVGLDWHDENMLDLNGVRPRKVRIYCYCEIYLPFDEFNGSCFLDESSVEES